MTPSDRNNEGICVWREKKIKKRLYKYTFLSGQTWK